MRIMRTFYTTMALMGLGALAACGNGGETGSGTNTEAGKAVDAIPAGQLGMAVVPEHYRLNLTILPEEERFSGRVGIDVTINQPSSVIFLHGNDLTVEDVWLTTGEQRIEASYEQVDATGIARLDLDQVPPLGAATLHFVYDAPFNGALEGSIR